MEVLYAILIIIIVLCLLTIIYILNYNKLQDAKIKIDEAEIIIDENLRKKYDFLITCKNIIEKTIKNQKIDFKGLENLKNENISNFDLDRKLNSHFEFISQVSEDYKELEENHKLQEILFEIKRIDEKIDSAKEFYNKYISESNTLVLKFPSNIVARFHNISAKKFFDNKNRNDDDFNDFKL